MRGGAEQIRSAWARAQSRWTGEAAQAYFDTYIRPLEETAEDLERAVRDLQNTAQACAQSLSALEAGLNN